MQTQLAQCHPAQQQLPAYRELEVRRNEKTLLGTMVPSYPLAYPELEVRCNSYR